MRRHTLVLLVVLATLAYFILPLRAQTTQSDCPPCSSFGVQRFPEKKEAPFFNLKRIDGTYVNLKDLRGKPALLFFWATWCPSCKEEIGLFEKFLRGKTAELSIYTLVIDGENEKAVRKTINQHGISLPVLLDVKEKIARAYGVKMVPTTYLISQEGSIPGVIIGQRDWSSPEAWSVLRALFNLH